MAAECIAGPARAVEALLCSHGGFPVLLRLPGLAVSGADGEQLGLSTPLFQEVPVGPAVWRRNGSDAVLLIGARAIADLAGSKEYSAAIALFQSAVGIVSDGELYTIDSAKAVIGDAMPCAYLLTLQAPVWR